LAPFLAAPSGILAAIDAARIKRWGWFAALVGIVVGAVVVSLTLLIVIAGVLNGSPASYNTASLVPAIVPPVLALVYLRATRDSRAKPTPLTV
jgi:hypothetical protein